MQISDSKMEYLKLLARTYRSEEEVCAEIINLMAIQNLPKGTDYFLSDIHGEYEAFTHILRNAAGTIKRRIDEIFPDVDESERKTLATLIYYPQDKLVRVIRGEVYDVAVDLREGSETYGKWFGVILSETNKKQFFIPKGFAHGFLVLSDYAEFCYKVTDFYHPNDEGGLMWNDPEIAVEWPMPEGMP